MLSAIEKSSANRLKTACVSRIILSRGLSLRSYDTVIRAPAQGFKVATFLDRQAASKIAPGHG